MTIEKAAEAITKSTNRTLTGSFTFFHIMDHDTMMDKKRTIVPAFTHIQTSFSKCTRKTGL